MRKGKLENQELKGNKFSDKLKKYKSRFGDSLYNVVQRMDDWSSIDGYKYKENGKYGVKLHEKSINPIYDEILRILPAGRGAICKLNEKVYFVDFDNKIFSKKYDNMEPIYVRTPMVSVNIGDKWGIVDYKGQEIVPPKYDKLFIPCNYNSDSLGFVIVVKNGKYGALSTKDGTIITETEYNSLEDLGKKGFGDKIFELERIRNDKKTVSIIHGKLKNK